MQEHPHKRLIMLTVILSIAAILCVVYYFSMGSRPRSNKGPAPLSPADIKEINEQSDATNIPGPGALTPQQIQKADSVPEKKGPGALTPEQIKALDAQ